MKNRTKAISSVPRTQNKMKKIRISILFLTNRKTTLNSSIGDFTLKVKEFWMLVNLFKLICRIKKWKIRPHLILNRA